MEGYSMLYLMCLIGGVCIGVALMCLMAINKPDE